jgi:hypothetical protein
MTQLPLVHPSHALESLSNLHIAEYDLLATEVNNYAYALRTRTGRTTFTALEVRVLFNRMLDIMVLKPEVTANEPQDLDKVKSLEDTMNEVPKAIEKRRV